MSRWPAGPIRQTCSTSAIAWGTAACDDRAQPQSLVDRLGLARDDEDLRHLPAERAEHAQDRTGLEAVRVDQWRLALGHGAGRLDHLGLVDLEQRDRPGRLAVRRRVDQHQHVVAVEQLVGQVHPADAEVDQLDAVRQRRPAIRPATSTPKPSSVRKMLPTPGDEGPHRAASVAIGASGSTSSGAK